MPTLTLEQIRLTGLEALSKTLGPVGMVRFLQQFEAGSGDYSTERHKNFPQKTVKELGEELKILRAKNSKNKKSKL